MMSKKNSNIKILILFGFCLLLFSLLVLKEIRAASPCWFSITDLSTSPSSTVFKSGQSFECRVTVSAKKNNGDHASVHCGIVLGETWVSGCSWIDWDGNTGRFDCQAPTAEGVYSLIGYEFESYCDSPDKVKEISVCSSPSQIPEGYFDGANCDSFWGWARDPDTTTPIYVDLYSNGPAGSGTFLGSILADQHESDLCNLWGNGNKDCYHGFLFSVPDSLKNGQNHDIYVYGVDSTGCPRRLLGNIPKTINCAPPSTPNQPPTCNSLSVKTSIESEKTVPVSADPQDDKGIDRVEFWYVLVGADYCNSGIWNLIDRDYSDSGGWSVSWDTGGITDGDYYVVANVYDTNNAWCSGNPAGTCGSTAVSCPNCKKQVNIIPSACPDCEVEEQCRDHINKACTANDAKDNDISQLGDSIDDYWCTYNEHDGCQYVKSGVEIVNGQFNPGFWEGESCAYDSSGDSSILYGEKKVYVDDVSKYIIKARVNIDDQSWVWINDSEVPGLHRDYPGWTSSQDVTSYFNTGWNTIKFSAKNTCSGDRYFNLDWDVSLRETPPQLTPTVDIKANGSDGPITIDYNTSATLSWTSSNADSCTASGDWSGSKATSGSESTGNLTSAKTYTLTCTGLAGSADDSVTVKVSSAPVPDISWFNDKEYEAMVAKLNEFSARYNIKTEQDGDDFAQMRTYVNMATAYATKYHKTASFSDKENAEWYWSKAFEKVKILNNNGWGGSTWGMPMDMSPFIIASALLEHRENDVLAEVKKACNQGTEEFGSPLKGTDYATEAETNAWFAAFYQLADQFTKGSDYHTNSYDLGDLFAGHVFTWEERPTGPDTEYKSVHTDNQDSDYNPNTEVGSANIRMTWNRGAEWPTPNYQAGGDSAAGFLLHAILTKGKDNMGPGLKLYRNIYGVASLHHYVDVNTSSYKDVGTNSGSDCSPFRQYQGKWISEWGDDAQYTTAGFAFGLLVSNANNEQSWYNDFATVYKQLVLTSVSNPSEPYPCNPADYDLKKMVWAIMIGSHAKAHLALTGWRIEEILPEFAKADLNQDGKTDTDDFKILLKNWGEPALAGADLNFDGVVSAIDLEIMRREIKAGE